MDVDAIAEQIGEEFDAAVADLELDDAVEVAVAIADLVRGRLDSMRDDVRRRDA